MSVLKEMYFKTISLIGKHQQKIYVDSNVYA